MPTHTEACLGQEAPPEYRITRRTETGCVVSGGWTEGPGAPPEKEESPERVPEVPIPIRGYLSWPEASVTGEEATEEAPSRADLGRFR